MEEARKVEFISIPELASRIGVSSESLYRQLRAGEKIPGSVKIGRRYVCNWDYFCEASRASDITPAA